MVLSITERKQVLEEDVSEEFLVALVVKLKQVYATVRAEADEMGLDVYAKEMRRYLRRVRTEQALLEVAKEHGFLTRPATNKSQDIHAVVVRGRIAMTESRCRGPLSPPREALFRSVLAGYSDHGQVRMELFGDEEIEEPVPIADDSSPVYVVISHGPSTLPGLQHELGFVIANFLAPNGKAYIGPGIDLLSRYGADQSVAVPPPTVTLRAAIAKQQAAKQRA